jgi:hypothetical protein
MFQLFHSTLLASDREARGHSLFDKKKKKEEEDFFVGLPFGSFF